MKEAHTHSLNQTSRSHLAVALADGYIAPCHANQAVIVSRSIWRCKHQTLLTNTCGIYWSAALHQAVNIDADIAAC